MKFLIRYLVSLLVFTVLLGILLDCVVGKVHEKIGVSFEAEKRRSSSDVTLRKPICLSNSIKACQQHIMPNIKLSTFIKQRLFNILLQYKCPRISITTLLLTLQPQQNIIQRIADRDPITTVTKLPWFNYPHILLFISPLLLLLQLAVVVVEYFVLWVISSFGDVKGEGQTLKDVEAAERIVFSHVIEKCFLVANVVILFEVVVQ